MHARHRAIPLVLLATAAVALTACGPGAGAGTGATTEPTGPGSVSTTASARPTSGGSESVQPSTHPTSAHPTATRTKPAAPAHPSPTAKHSATTQPSSGGTGDGNANNVQYAWTHPCKAAQLTIKVKIAQIPGFTTNQRLIEATNNGSASCGLSYYPGVTVVKSDTIGVPGRKAQILRPLVPEGLGGQPAKPLFAKHTAYAVLDLDPSFAMTDARDFDKIGVVYSTDVPNVRPIYFPIIPEGGQGSQMVKNPYLGLYSDTIAHALESVGLVRG